MSLLLYILIHFAAGLLGWLWAEVRGLREGVDRLLAEREEARR